jgi:hypothetical protein
MMFWHEVDGALLRESAKMAGPVRESIQAQVDIDEIIRQWNLSYPKGAEVTTAEARAWAKVHVVVDNTELNKGLGILYAIGWMFGRDVATSAYAHARLNKAAPTDEALNALLNIDWANWVPGRNPGALLAAPPGGLKGLLQRRGLDLQGLTNTLLNRIGTHLADALMSGASDTMLGKVLETVVGDPERALTIANTSMASAMSVSSRETYQEFGVAKMRWLALEPCSTCSGNGAMGPVTPGEAVFKNVQGDNITEPPAHPNCRCALSPVIDLDQFKFSVHQARDSHGRWTDSGFGAVDGANEAIERWKEKGFIATKIQRPDLRRNSYGHLSDSLPIDAESRDIVDKINKKIDEETLRVDEKAIFNEAFANAKERGLSDRSAGYEAEGAKRAAIAYANTQGTNVLLDNATAMFEKYPGKFNSNFEENYKEYFTNSKQTLASTQNLLGKAIPTVAIDQANFIQAIEDGRLKSQYETKTSSGLLSTSTRKTVEAGYMGVGVDTKPINRPIYGYLTTQDSGTSPFTSGYNSDRWNLDNHGVNQYGNVRLQLKESARANTTYTMVDSLDGYAIGQPLTAPATKARLVAGGFYTDVTTSHGGMFRETYTEAQIHGGVKMSDIARIGITGNADPGVIKTALDSAGYSDIEVVDLRQK